MDNAERVDGVYIRRRRLAAGMSQRELARRAGYDNSYISQVESGRRPVSTEFLRRCEAAIRRNQADLPTVSKLSVRPSRPSATSSCGHFGPELRRLRMSKGWSLRDLASLIPCDRRTLGNVETGRKRPGRRLAERCDEALGAGGRLFALLDDERRHPASDEDVAWLIGVDMSGAGWHTAVSRRTLVETCTLAGAVGLFSPPVPPRGVDLGQHTLMFDQMRGVCQRVRPQLTLPLLLDQTNRLRLLANEGSRRARQTMVVIGAHFAMYLGKMFQEAGEAGLAARWTATAGTWAAEANDPGLSAMVLIRRAMLALYQGRAADTVDLARLAQQVKSAPDRIVGMAASREALGHAQIGDELTCRRALERASRLLTHAVQPPPELAPLEASNVADPVAITTAWCTYDLGSPREAAMLLDRELEQIPAHARRTHARFGVRRALAYAAAGEIDHACALTRILLPAIADAASSTVRRDLSELVRVLSRRRSHIGARELLPAINEVLVASTSRSTPGHA